MIRRLTPLFSLLLALACGSPTEPTDPFRLGEPFWLEIGRTAASDAAATLVRYDRVVADSRCPGGNIVCVWAGDITVELSVTTPSAGTSHTQLNEMLDPRSATLPAQQRRIELLAYADQGDLRTHTHTGSRVQLRVTALP